MEEPQPEEGRPEDFQRHAEAAGMPDLALNLQAMRLADQNLSTVKVNQVYEEKELDFSFCLLLKVACTGGVPRNITESALKQSMARAWRNNYYDISQVSNTVFLAHFRTHDDMMAVYTRQPWFMGSDTLLLDWFDVGDEVNSVGDYRFDYIFVTVRVYGIPRTVRSITLLSDILNTVGNASEYHLLEDNNLLAKQDYIWGIAKLKVNSPVKDKIRGNYPDNKSGIIYLHYEKIKRIRLFCGIMFHNVQHCPVRTSMLKERSRRGLSVHDFPTQRLGKWILDERFIPAEAFQTLTISNRGVQSTSNPVLARLRKLFAEDPKGKGKHLEANSSMMHAVTQGQFYPPGSAVNSGQDQQTSFVTPNNAHCRSQRQIGGHGEIDKHGSHLSLPLYTPQLTGQSFNEGVRQLQELSSSIVAVSEEHSHAILPPHDTLTTVELHVNQPQLSLFPVEKHVPKRPLPNSDPMTQPIAKKISNDSQQEGDGVGDAAVLTAGQFQAAEKPVNSSLPCDVALPQLDPLTSALPTRDYVFDACVHSDARGPAGASHTGAGTEKAGVTVDTAAYGSAGQMGSAGPMRKHRGSHQGHGMHPYSASYRRSPQCRSSEGAPEFDLRSLQTPSLSWSQGSVDSRIDDSQPPKVGECHMVPDAQNVGAGQRSSTIFEYEPPYVADRSVQIGLLQEEKGEASEIMDTDQRALGWNCQGVGKSLGSSKMCHLARIIDSTKTQFPHGVAQEGSG